MIAQRFLKGPWPFIAAWWLGGFLTIVVPTIKWNKSKSYFYNAVGRYREYERNQRSYEDGQNYNQNGNNNNNNQNNNGYATMKCGWWQYKCRQQQYYYRAMQNGGNDNQVMTPNWYQFLGGKNEEEDREAREEMGIYPDEATGAVKFVFAWSIIIFVTLLLYGTYAMAKKKSTGMLVLTLGMILQYSLLVILLLPQGVISTDDRDLEESIYGWYGQLPVLMVYFYYAQIWFAGVFLLVFGAKWLLELYYYAPEVRKDETTADYQPAEKLDVA